MTKQPSCCVIPNQTVLIRRLTKANEKYFQGLRKRQRKAVKAYQIASDNFYSPKEMTLSFNLLNMYLRDAPNQHLTDTLTTSFPEWKKSVATEFDTWTTDLKIIIKNAPKLPKQPFVVYRGIGGNELFQHLKKGDRLAIDGFLSTSYNPELAQQYLGEKNIVTNPTWYPLLKKHKISISPVGGTLQFLRSLSAKKRNQYEAAYGFPTIPDPHNPWKYMMQIRLPPGTPILMPTF